MIVHFSAQISKWELVCKFGVIFHIFIISCLGSWFHAWSSWFFYSIITFSCTKYFAHSYTVDVVFTLFMGIPILVRPHLHNERAPQGSDSVSSCCLTRLGNSIVEIRQSYDCFISTMRFPIMVIWYLCTEPVPWAPFKIKTIFPGIGIHIISLRWFWDLLIFIMGLMMLVKEHLYIEPRCRTIV